MPYSSVDDLPEYVKKYTAKVQRQWRHVFNSTYDKVLRETDSRKQAEARAFRAANSVLDKRFKNEDARATNTEHDMLMYHIDKYLGNFS